MKKTIYVAAAAFMIAGMAACSNKNCEKKGTDIPDQTYTGVLPAADGPGVRYTLKIDYDDDKNNQAGDYDLLETHLGVDSLGLNGVNDSVSFKSEGDFTIMEQNGKKYLKLMKDTRDSHPSAADALYFLLSTDSTLTMVGADLQPSVSASLNYTLKLVK